MLYKYQIVRSDGDIQVGDVRWIGDKEIRIITIVKIDTDEMILYFIGVEEKEIDMNYGQ